MKHEPACARSLQLPRSREDGEAASDGGGAPSRLMDFAGPHGTNTNKDSI